MKPVLTVFLFITLFSGIAHGSSTTLSPIDGHENQNQITEALANYDTVYLEAGVYEVDENITINSGNTLTGDPDAIIRVWSGSDQWFVKENGIIKGSKVHDVEICNIQIDGNCDELPRDYANYVFNGGSGHHNAERGIDLRGSTNNFMSNISIHDLSVYDFFSDGIRVAYANNVYIYNNFISNSQHEGVYMICNVDSVVEGNEIAGITSDCIRFDNCQDSIICNNFLFSYNGTNNNGETEGRHQGLQISDQGRSFNSGSNQPLHTTNIEVYGNVFAGDKKMNVWVDSAGKGVENVYVHGNTYLDGKAVETSGISVNGVYVRDISYENQPSKELSKQVFNSILDFLFNKQYITQYTGNETIILPNNRTESPSEVTGTIEYYKLGDNYTTYVKIPTKGLSEIQYEVNGETATHTLMIGERTAKGIVFTQTSIWRGNLTHEIDALKLKGKVDEENIKVTCITPKTTFEPELETVTTEFTTAKFNPYAIASFCVVLIIGWFIKMSFRYLK